MNPLAEAVTILLVAITVLVLALVTLVVAIVITTRHDYHHKRHAPSRHPNDIGKP